MKFRSHALSLLEVSGSLKYLDEYYACVTRDASSCVLTLVCVQVAEVEHAILTRKGEVEKLIADMKSANLESLTISPPEETKAFLDGTLLFN